MFKFLFKKNIIEAENRIFEAWEKEKEQNKINQKLSKQFEIESMLGKLVISISNEIENVTVGVATEVIHITKELIPQIVIYDLVRKKEVVPLGKVFAYSEQKFNAFNKLEANERIAIIYHTNEYHKVNKEKTQKECLIPNDEWAEKVKNAIEQYIKEKS